MRNLVLLTALLLGSPALAHDGELKLGAKRVVTLDGERVRAGELAELLGDEETLRKIRAQRLPFRISNYALLGAATVTAAGGVTILGTGVVWLGHGFFCLVSAIDQRGFQNELCTSLMAPGYGDVLGFGLRVMLVGAEVAAVVLPFTLATGIVALPTRSVRRYWDQEELETLIGAYEADHHARRLELHLYPLAMADGGGLAIGGRW